MGRRTAQIIFLLTAVAVNPVITRLRAASPQPGLSFFSKLSEMMPSDTVSSPAEEVKVLPEFEVLKEKEPLLRQQTDGSVTVDGTAAGRSLRMLGEADMVLQLRRSAGVTSNGDYSSGLSVDGMDASQTDFLIDGAPVVYPFRFGGVFSTFNTGHFRSATLHRNGQSEDIPKLGSTVNFLPLLRKRDGSEGEASVGLTASSATLLFTSGRFASALSARVSYVDQIYGSFLRNKSSALGYSFADINMTLQWRPSSSDLLRASLFYSADRLGYEDRHYGMGTHIKWHNLVAGLHWEHTGTLRMDGNIWGSFFHNTLMIEMSALSLDGPSGLDSGGFRYSLGGDIYDRFRWKAGVNSAIYQITPQYASLLVEGSEPTGSVMKTTQTVYAGIFGSLEWDMIPDRLRSRLLFQSGGVTHEGLFLDPRVEIDYHPGFCDFSVSAGSCSQFLHRVGFSELGLSSDFWIGSDKIAPMERAWRVSAGAEKEIVAGISVNLRGYWAKVRNVPEYRGQILEIVNESYDVADYLLITSGHNAGFSTGVSKNGGPVTASFQYGYGVTRRHLPGETSFPGINSPGHSVLATAQWEIGSHWLISGMFCARSGRPYTPVKTLYLIAGNIAMEYGARNSARLPSYQRLDLGATYSFRTGKRHTLRHQVNLSLINAYGHRNVEMQYFIISSDGGNYFLKRLNSLYRFLPSVSYTLQF